jgi:hypothetical protein
MRVDEKEEVDGARARESGGVADSCALTEVLIGAIMLKQF